jgi:hypothetical protein
MRRTVRTLYAFACGYCGVTETEVGAYLTIDHFVLQDAGGSDEIENLVYACHACNLHKSAAWNLLTPPVLHPLRVDMTRYLRLNPEGVLTGSTPDGVLHIETLHLNRPPLVEHRKMRRLMETMLELEAERLEHEKRLDAEARVKTQALRRWKKRRQ